MQAPIRYIVSAPFPQNHLFEITLTLTCPDPAGQRLRLPVWIPGSYMVRDFARHIVDIRAESTGQAVLLQKCDKSTWQAEAVSGELIIYYRVYAYDLSVRGAYLDTTRGFFNGTSVFLVAVGQEDQRCSVLLEKPKGRAYQAWKVATSLQALQNTQQGFGEYLANNYEDLIDHPVEMGTFSHYQFDAYGIKHEVVITGRHRVDHQRLIADMQKICMYQLSFFGQPAPFTRYVFLLLVTSGGYGGLEHGDSSALICDRNDLPQPNQATMPSGYQRFLGLVSHEYFHSWNVKRIKPDVFATYDLTQENYTRLLWAFEGITSYYDDLTLLRTGLISVDVYLVKLGKLISSVIGQPGSTIQNLEEASFDAWIKYYRQDENSPNSLVSYYNKGAIVALLLDATIRHASKGRSSLDDVMRTLWQRYGKDFAKTRQGVPELAWEKIAQEVTGVDLSEFFAQALRKTTRLPLKKCLAYLGIDYQERAALSSQDMGGVWHEQIQPAPITLGIRCKDEPYGVRITHVLTGSPAERAGLAAGDVLIALDNVRIDAATLEAIQYTDKQRIILHIFRQDELIRIPVKLFLLSRQVCALRMKKSEQTPLAASWQAN